MSSFHSPRKTPKERSGCVQRNLRGKGGQRGRNQESDSQTFNARKSWQEMSGPADPEQVAKTKAEVSAVVNAPSLHQFSPRDIAQGKSKWVRRNFHQKVESEPESPVLAAAKLPQDTTEAARAENSSKAVEKLKAEVRELEAEEEKARAVEKVSQGGEKVVLKVREDLFQSAERVIAGKIEPPIDEAFVPRVIVSAAVFVIFAGILLLMASESFQSELELTSQEGVQQEPAHAAASLSLEVAER